MATGAIKRWIGIRGHRGLAPRAEEDYRFVILATRDEFGPAIDAAAGARAVGITVHVAAFHGPHTRAGQDILDGAVDAEVTIVTYSSKTAQHYLNLLADPSKAGFAAAVADLAANPAYEAVALDGEIIFIPRRISDALGDWVW